MSSSPDFFETNRVILVHKQGTSARTRFLKLDYGGVLGFSPLPDLSSPVKSGGASSDSVVPKSRGVVKQAADRLGLEAGELAAEAEFSELIETPHGSIHVHLARFTAIDPPFELADQLGGKFIDITEARSIPLLELELLRQAYATVMG